MATAKRTTRRRSPPRRMTAQDRFTGLTGAWRSVAQFGTSGVVAATMMYAVLVMLPDIQQKHLDSIKEDRRAAYEHGEKAVDKIATSIDGLKSSFGSVQSVTQGNQKELIRLQSRAVELLEQHDENKVSSPREE